MEEFLMYVFAIIVLVVLVILFIVSNNTDPFEESPAGMTPENAVQSKLPNDTYGSDYKTQSGVAYAEVMQNYSLTPDIYESQREFVNDKNATTSTSSLNTVTDHDVAFDWRLKRPNYQQSFTKKDNIPYDVPTQEYSIYYDQLPEKKLYYPL